MSRDGSGAYSLPGADLTNGTLADADEVMAKLNDIATALTVSLAKDGQTTPTANLPMGGFGHTGVAVAASRTMYARASQIADGALTYGGVAGGTADALTLAPSPAISAYVIGQRFQYKSGAAANTTAVTANVNSVGSGAVTWPDGTALVAGDHPANALLEIAVVTTAPTFHLMTPTHAPLTQAQTLALAKSFDRPGHRLSLTTAVPVTVADVTAAGTIYWTPSLHNVSPVYNGTLWVISAIAEKSLALDSNAGHTGYHQSGKNFDAFLDYNAGTPRMVTGPAWTSDTARAAAISRDATYGWYVNTASMTAKFDTSASNVTIAAGAGLYLGSFRATADAQTEDSLVKRFVWNMYNRVWRPMRALETANTWNYTTATIRQANAAAANQLDFLRGLDEDMVTATALAPWFTDTAGQGAQTMIGLDSTTVMATGCINGRFTAAGANAVNTNTARWDGLPGLGRHYLAWLERGEGTGTTTWAGDNNLPLLIQAGITGSTFS